MRVEILAHHRARRRGSDGRPRSCPSGLPAVPPRDRRRSARCAGSASHSSSNTGVLRQRYGVARARLGASPQPSSTTKHSAGTGRPCGPSSRSPARRSSGWRRPRSAAKRLGLERGAADERPVDVRQRQQLGRVLRLDRAAVEDPHARRGLLVAIADERADERRSPPAPARRSPRGRCRSPRSARTRSRPRRAARRAPAPSPPGPAGAACARCRRRRAPPRSRRRTGSAPAPPASAAGTFSASARSVSPK